MNQLDRIVFATPTVRVGAFRCPVDDPRFRDSGPIQGNLIVFPRRGVWIRQAGSRPLVADPRVVTIYNRGRQYDRAAVRGSDFEKTADVQRRFEIRIGCFVIDDARKDRAIFADGFGPIGMRRIGLAAR